MRMKKTFILRGTNYTKTLHDARMSGVVTDDCMALLPKIVLRSDVIKFIKDGTPIDNTYGSLSVKSKKVIIGYTRKVYTDNVPLGFVKIDAGLIINENAVLLFSANRREPYPNGKDLNRNVRFKTESGEERQATLAILYLRTFCKKIAGKTPVIKRLQQDGMLRLEPKKVPEYLPSEIVPVKTEQDIVNNCLLETYNMLKETVDFDKLLANTSDSKYVDIGVYNKENILFALLCKDRKKLLKHHSLKYVEKVNKLYREMCTDTIPKGFRLYKATSEELDIIVNDKGYVLNRLTKLPLEIYNGFIYGKYTNTKGYKRLDFSKIYSSCTNKHNTTVLHLKTPKNLVIKPRVLGSMSVDDYIKSTMTFELNYIEEQQRLIAMTDIKNILQKQPFLPNIEYGRWELNYFFVNTINHLPYHIPTALECISQTKVVNLIRENFPKRDKLLLNEGYVKIIGSDNLYINKQGYVFDSWLIRGTLSAKETNVISYKTSTRRSIDILKELYIAFVDRKFTYGKIISVSGREDNFTISDLKVQPKHVKRSKRDLDAIGVGRDIENMLFSAIENALELPVARRAKFVERFVNEFTLDTTEVLKLLQISIPQYNEYLDTGTIV